MSSGLLASLKLNVQSVGAVTDSDSLDKLMKCVTVAQAKMCLMTQEQVDRIFQACAVEAGKQRVRLAQLTVEESGMGVMEDKVIKNHFSSEVVYNAYKDVKTCGVIEYAAADGFAKYAEPVGVLAGAIPCTNPTSTAIFKCLLALKTRNAIVISPHPRTAKCTIEAARIIRNKAVELGAPEHCIGWIDAPTPDLCSVLMKHDAVSMIVATGAGGLVKAAYSSGKPAMGGGSGNTPVIIDETADVPMAVNSVLLSKTFDNGMICASEQSIVAMKPVAEAVRAELKLRGAYFLNADEKKKIGDVILMDNGVLNPPAVGQSATKLCELAGITGAPKGVRLLVADLTCVGPAEKLSHEKLCPCVGFFTVDTFDQALDRAYELVNYGGLGHTSVLYTNITVASKQDRINRFQAKMPTGRTLICMPASQGAIGGVFNNRQHPSMSLGCGTWGHNATAESLQVKHLLNVKEVCERRGLPHQFSFPEKIVGPNALETVLKHIKSSVALIADSTCADVAARAAQMCQVTSTTMVEDEVDVEKAKEIASRLTDDCVILAVGGTAAISAGKAARIYAACNRWDGENLELRSFDLRTKMTQAEQSSHRLICVSSASTGCEMVPHAIVREGDVLRFISDSVLRADTVVVDDGCIRSTGAVPMKTSAFIAMVNALDAHVTLASSQLTRSYSSRGLRALYEGLISGKSDPETINKLQHGSIDTGISVGNAGVGLCCALYCAMAPLKVPRKVAMASVVRQVILFNAEETPAKMGTSAGYTKPIAGQLYGEVAKEMGLKGGINELVEKLGEISKKLGFATSLKEFGVPKDLFDKHLDSMALRAFDSQGAMGSPRYPLLKETKRLLQLAYDGTVAPTRLGDCC